MFFSIEPNNGVAIYEQLMRQVKFAVADDTLKPGQLLPSVRVLSQQLAINPNTINKAFQQLQGEGILESIRGRGIAVHADAMERCVNDRRTLIADRFRAVIVEALQAGYSDVEISSLVQDQLQTLEHLQTAKALSANALSAKALPTKTQAAEGKEAAPIEQAQSASSSQSANQNSSPSSGA